MIAAGAEAAWARLRDGVATAPTVVPCAGAGRPLWHSESETEQGAAARACLECPVMVLCDAYASTADERSGVWGGWTEKERRRARRRTRRATA
ncbi:transcription factor WhiB [Brachybacterium sp. AG952]|nr:transcription factor WhiB [Brachybacterium sp. AG952]